MIEKAERKRKTLTATVVSNKMEKTAVVQVQRTVQHPVYKKYLTKRVKYKVHDEKNELGVGDVVRIAETRPLSRDKRWRLIEVLEKAQQD
jgi:small subunit ribosomal protein S17